MILDTKKKKKEKKKTSSHAQSVCEEASVIYEHNI